MEKIFDINALKNKRDLVAKSKSNHNHFLLEYITHNIDERFNSLGIEFEDILLIGLMSDKLVQNLADKAKNNFCITDISQGLIDNYTKYNQALYDNEIIYSKNKFDLIYSFLDLHHINKIPEHLASIKHILKPDGIFMGCFFGEENLKNLRLAFQKADKETISPKFFPQIEIKTAGNILQKSGFAEPITDIDKINITYSKLNTFCKDIKNIAETNILIRRNSFITNRNFIKDTEKLMLNQANEFDVEVQIINFICYNKNT